MFLKRRLKNTGKSKVGFLGKFGGPGAGAPGWFSE
jgi:hypothetical protein